MGKNFIIAVDFDGVLHDSKFSCYPGIGTPNTIMIGQLKHLHILGCKLILWTNREGTALEKAVDWCRDQGLIFDAVNENLPETTAWMGYSRKIFANAYIDDRAVNYKFNSELGETFISMDLNSMFGKIGNMYLEDFKRWSNKEDAEEDDLK